MKNWSPYIFLLIFSVGLLQVSCQKNEFEEPTLMAWVEINGVFEFVPVSKSIEYIGGQSAFFEAISAEISYPPEARQNGIEGTVILEFEVTELGTVENIVIKEDIGGGCGEEAKRMLEVITQGTSFTPAELDGVPVRSRMELPIKFILG